MQDKLQRTLTVKVVKSKKVATIIAYLAMMLPFVIQKSKDCIGTKMVYAKTYIDEANKKVSVTITFVNDPLKIRDAHVCFKCCILNEGLKAG